MVLDLVEESIINMVARACPEKSNIDEWDLKSLEEMGLEQFNTPITIGELRDMTREALENLNTPYAGLIKTYNKPFTPEVHDAITENDYVWTQFIDNQILPVGMQK